MIHFDWDMSVRCALVLIQGFTLGLMLVAGRRQSRRVRRFKAAMAEIRRHDAAVLEAMKAGDWQRAELHLAAVADALERLDAASR